MPLPAWRGVRAPTHHVQACRHPRHMCYGALVPRAWPYCPLTSRPMGCHACLPRPAGSPPTYLKSSCNGDGGNGLFVMRPAGPPVVVGVTSYGVVGGRVGEEEGLSVGIDVSELDP